VKQNERRGDKDGAAEHNDVARVEVVVVVER
jgi:hypothetical protein